MKDSTVIYYLTVEDIQEVAEQVIERSLSAKEIKKIIPFIEKRIGWYDAIADSIHEIIESKEKP